MEEVRIVDFITALRAMIEDGDWIRPVQETRDRVEYRHFWHEDENIFPEAGGDVWLTTKHVQDDDWHDLDMVIAVWIKDGKCNHWDSHIDFPFVDEMQGMWEVTKFDIEIN